jgi:hypothetical protein
MKFMKPLAAFIVLIALSACSRDKDQVGEDVGFSNLDGKVLFQSAGSIYRIDMKSGVQDVYFKYNTYSFSNWDMSFDGKYRLTSEDETGTISTTIFKLMNASDGQIVDEFKYTPPEGSGSSYSGRLAPDNNLVMIQPDFDNGIILINRKGEVVHHLPGINNEKFTISDGAIWMPDNSLLIHFKDKMILRSYPPYNNLTLVKEMNYESWGSLDVSRDGKQLSCHIGGHIFVMNSDGSNLIQVTESTRTENMGAFSPDGRHLLIGTKYIHAPLTGSRWHLAVIPNDGKKYDLESDPVVLEVKAVNDFTPFVSGRSLWVP